MMKDLRRLKADIERFIKEKGKPSLVVGPKALRFQLLEIFLPQPDLTFVTLPVQVWERNKIYIENEASHITLFAE